MLQIQTRLFFVTYKFKSSYGPLRFIFWDARLLKIKPLDLVLKVKQRPAMIMSRLSTELDTDEL